MERFLPSYCFCDRLAGHHHVAFPLPLPFLFWDVIGHPPHCGGIPATMLPSLYSSLARSSRSYHLVTAPPCSKLSITTGSRKMPPCHLPILILLLPPSDLLSSPLPTTMSSLNWDDAIASLPIHPGYTQASITIILLGLCQHSSFAHAATHPSIMPMPPHYFEVAIATFVDLSNTFHRQVHSPMEDINIKMIKGFLGMTHALIHVIGDLEFQIRWPQYQLTRRRLLVSI